MSSWAISPLELKPTWMKPVLVIYTHLALGENWTITPVANPTRWTTAITIVPKDLQGGMYVRLLCHPLKGNLLNRVHLHTIPFPSSTQEETWHCRETLQKGACFLKSKIKWEYCELVHWNSVGDTLRCSVAWITHSVPSSNSRPPTSVHNLQSPKQLHKIYH